VTKAQFIAVCVAAYLARRELFVFEERPEREALCALALEFAEKAWDALRAIDEFGQYTRDA
jgi:hypothetical protein